MDVRNKVAVVTGAGSGIGRAAAVALAQAGASVIVADVDAAASREAVTSIARGGGTATAVHCDVSVPGDVRALIDAADQRFGGLDILCNNAGVNTGPPGYPNAPLEQWQRVLDVNLRAVILGTQTALPALRRRGGGVVVNTASLAGLVGFAGDPVYAATKAAVIMFTHSMAGLVQERIRVNCVCPGMVDTPMLQQALRDPRSGIPANVPLARPEEIADAIMQLVTDDALAGCALCVGPGWRDFAVLPGLRLPSTSPR